jgi:hypothetical protein
VHQVVSLISSRVCYEPFSHCPRYNSIQVGLAFPTYCVLVGRRSSLSLLHRLDRRNGEGAIVLLASKKQRRELAEASFAVKKSKGRLMSELLCGVAASSSTLR